MAQGMTARYPLLPYGQHKIRGVMKHEDDVSKAYTDIPEIEREDRFFIAIQMVCD